MWQRIQTLYLAAATVLVGLLFFVDKAVTPGAGGAADVVYRYTDHLLYLVFIIVITLLNLIALTTFRHRVLQMRTAVLSALVTLALQVMIVLDFAVTHEEMVFRVSAVFPIAAAIFDLLAARAVLADQMLVESVSRLRSSRRKAARSKRSR